MSEYETEEQQIEAIKEWWKENGSSVILGILLGVGGILSWTGWKFYTAEQALSASDLYTQVSEAVANGDLKTASSVAGDLRDDHGGLTFAAMATLLEAKAQVDSKELLDEAVESLQWVIDNAALEEYKTVARLRLARILLAQGKNQDALAALPDESELAFAGSIAEVRGDILLAEGDIDGARTAYQAAQTSAGVADPQLLDNKLNDLARSDSPASSSSDDS